LLYFLQKFIFLKHFLILPILQFGKFGGGGKDKKSEKHRPSATPAYRPNNDDNGNALEVAYNQLSDDDINEKFEQMLVSNMRSYWAYATC
jgi:hypothetical protein